MGAARGGDQTPPPPAKSTATYLGIPPTHSKPFPPPPPLPPRKVSEAEAPAGAAGRGGLTAAGSRLWVSLPASVPLSRHLSGGNGSSRSSDSVLSAPSFQSAQPGRFLSEGTLAPVPLFPPSTTPALQKHFSRCGAFSSYPDQRGLELLALCPEAGGGATRVPRAWLCLGQEANALQGWCWAGWGGSVLPGEGGSWLFPGCPRVPPTQRVTPSLSHSCPRPTDIMGMPRRK